MTIRAIRFGVAALATLACAAAPLVAVPTMEIDEPPSQEELALMFDELETWFADLLTLGEPEPGWSDGGVDMQALWETAPGGTARHHLLSVNAAGDRQLMVSSGHALAALIPEGWTLIEQFGPDAAAAEPSDLQITPIDDRYIYVARGPTSRVGQAECSAGEPSVLLYERAGAPSDMAAGEARVLLGYLLDRFGNLLVCARFDELAPGRYAMRYYSEDGRPLVRLNEQREVIEIVPVGPIEALLGLD